MKTTWHQFTGNHTDENASLIISGSFAILPRENEDFTPQETEILIVIYNVINESNKAKIFGQQQVIYILINGDDVSVGDIVNQRPEFLHSDFYETVKRIVVSEYNSVHK